MATIEYKVQQSEFIHELLEMVDESCVTIETEELAKKTNIPEEILIALLMERTISPKFTVEHLIRLVNEFNSTIVILPLNIISGEDSGDDHDVT